MKWPSTDKLQRLKLLLEVLLLLLLVPLVYHALIKGGPHAALAGLAGRTPR